MKRKCIAVFIATLLLASSFTSVAAQSYTVVKGDTLWDLGIKYDVEWGQIAELNGVNDPRKLQIGTVLEIPGEEPAVEPTPEVTHMEYNVTIPNGDYQIPGSVTLPIGEGPFPAVVMLHGTGSQKNEAGDGYKLTAPALAEAGVASIRIDFIGTGDSLVDYIDYNFTTAVSDANAAFNYMATLEGIDATRIGVMGWSQGGTIAMLAAAENRSFQSVVTWAGAPDMSIGASQEAYETAKADGFYLQEYPWRTSLRVSEQWYEDVFNTDLGCRHFCLVTIKIADGHDVDSRQTRPCMQMITGKEPSTDQYTGFLRSVVAVHVDWSPYE